MSERLVAGCYWFWTWEWAGFLISLGALRTPGFSVGVARAEVGFEEEFELFMQLLMTYCELLRAALRRRSCRALAHRHRSLTDAPFAFAAL